MRNIVIRLSYILTSFLITYLLVFKTFLYKAINEGKVSFYIMAFLLFICITIVFMCIDIGASIIDYKRYQKRHRRKNYVHREQTKQKLQNIDVRDFNYVNTK